MATQGCANARGERLTSFSFGHLRVLVEPSGAEFNDAALALAEKLEADSKELFALTARVNRLELALERSRASASDLRRHLEIALGEREDYSRGVFWARECDCGRGAEVWLLPEGGGFDRFGLRFDGWEDLARARPELRPVGVGGDSTGHYVILKYVSIRHHSVPPAIA